MRIRLFVSFFNEVDVTPEIFRWIQKISCFSSQTQNYILKNKLGGVLVLNFWQATTLILLAFNNISHESLLLAGH